MASAGAGSGAGAAAAAPRSGDIAPEALWDLAVPDAENTLGGLKDDIPPDHPSVIGSIGEQRGAAAVCWRNSAGAPNDQGVERTSRVNVFLSVNARILRTRARPFRALSAAA